MFAQIKVRWFFTLILCIFAFLLGQLLSNLRVVNWPWGYFFIFRVCLHIGKPSIDPGGVDGIVPWEFSSVILKFIHDVALQAASLLLIFYIK